MDSPAKEDCAWTFLENASLSELQKFSFFDFIFHVKKFMLLPDEQEYIDKFSKVVENEPKAVFDLYILAFVYRDIPYIEAKYTLYERQLKAEPLIAPFRQGECPSKIKQIPPVIFQMKKEAAYLIKTILTECKKPRKLTKQRELDPLKEKFRKLLDLEQTQKVVIIDELEKMIGLNRKESHKKVFSLKRKYYRWKNLYSDELINRKWPTEDFLAFLALISKKYVRIPEGYPVLTDVSHTDLNVCRIRKAGLNPHCSIKRNEDYLKIELKKALKLCAKDKEEKLRKLAKKNYLPAIEEYCRIVSIPSKEKCILRGAILGNIEYAKELDWKARGFVDMPLEVCARYTKLRTRENRFSFSRLIPMNSIVDSFSFSINEKNEKSLELYNQLKGKRLDPYKCYNYEDSTHIKTATVKATPKNLDLIMKYADIFFSPFEIQFPNKQYIHTQIWRGKIQSPEEPLQNEEPVKEETPKPPMKQCTDREKLEIALMGSNPAWTIDDLCSMYGITKEMYNKWSAQLSKALPKIFECDGEDQSGEQDLETSKPQV